MKLPVRTRQKHWSKWITHAVAATAMVSLGAGLSGCAKATLKTEVPRHESQLDLRSPGQLASTSLSGVSPLQIRGIVGTYTGTLIVPINGQLKRQTFALAISARLEASNGLTYAHGVFESQGEIGHFAQEADLEIGRKGESLDDFLFFDFAMPASTTVFGTVSNELLQIVATIVLDDRNGADLDESDIFISTCDASIGLCRGTSSNVWLRGPLVK